MVDGTLVDWLKAFIYVDAPCNLKLISLGGEHMNEAMEANGWNLTDFADAFLDLIKGRLLDYPYAKSYMDNIDNKFSLLCAHQTKTSDFEYGPTLDEDNRKFISFQSDLLSYRFRNGFMRIKYDKGDYALDQITDYFCEHVRLSCRVRRPSARPLARRDYSSYYMSPIEAWESKDVLRALMEYLVRKTRSLNSFNLRHGLFHLSQNSGLFRECTSFFPTKAKSVITLLRAKKVLDFSAGWGDRLLGAIAAGVECYHGVDPNQRLSGPSGVYEAIVSKFAPKDKHSDRFRFFPHPFETLDLPNGVSYDLVFSSPPFFDFEMYSDDPADSSQSVYGKSSVQHWLTTFLFVALQKAWAALRPGGYVALYMSDVLAEHRVVEPTLLYMMACCKGCEFEGCIGIETGRHVARPVWVMKKRQDDPGSVLDKVKHAARTDFLTFFPDVFGAIYISDEVKKSAEGAKAGQKRRRRLS